MLNDDDIYYGNQSSWQYFSVSQVKDFQECEAAALAKLKQEWQPASDPTALLVGNYVHSYFESAEAHEIFKEKNSDKLFKKNGDLYKAFEVAEQMIKRVEREPLFKALWQGENEVPVTGELFGVDWKGKIDLLNIEKGYFVDLKTNAMFSKRIWSDKYGGYASFVEAYGYVLQLAIYETLLEQRYGKPFEGYIFAVSKQDPPNVEAIQVSEFKKEFELNLMREQIDHIAQVKNGEIKPEMCGKCEYCRGHKQLNGFILSDELI